MLEGEKQALLTQVTQLVQATETKIQRLGLQHVKVGLWDHRTKQPIGHPDELIDMAEGKTPAALADLPSAPEPEKEVNDGGGE